MADKNQRPGQLIQAEPPTQEDFEISHAEPSLYGVDEKYAVVSADFSREEAESKLKSYCEKMGFAGDNVSAAHKQKFSWKQMPGYRAGIEGFVPDDSGSYEGWIVKLTEVSSSTSTDHTHPHGVEEGHTHEEVK